MRSGCGLLTFSVATQYLLAVSVPLKPGANAPLIVLGTSQGTQIALGCLGKPDGFVAVWGLLSFKCTMLVFPPKYLISFDFQGH